MIIIMIIIISSASSTGSTGCCPRCGDALCICDHVQVRRRCLDVLRACDTPVASIFDPTGRRGMPRAASCGAEASIIIIYIIIL